jgi:hypothetical protein
MLMIDKALKGGRSYWTWQICLLSVIAAGAAQLSHALRAHSAGVRHCHGNLGDRSIFDHRILQNRRFGPEGN